MSPEVFVISLMAPPMWMVRSAKSSTLILPTKGPLFIVPQLYRYRRYTKSILRLICQHVFHYEKKQ